MTLLPQIQPLSVSEITAEIKELVEANLDSVCVCGEISNCKAASSGHIYFTLKDDGSQLASVIWRTAASRLPFKLQDGMKVIALGAIEVYAARGNYQLIISRVFPDGVGALEQALQRLKEKLAAEGLFSPDRKRRIPRLPNRIALITSPHGAAVRDLLQVITRRWPTANIVIWPVAVQGASAAPEIAAALQSVHLIPDVDVVICGRGGGSLEDLWAFNEEIVARAIANCRVPVISAVGHEIDVTIADLVADVRALTPSEAGELVVPNRHEIIEWLAAMHQRLITALKQRANQSRLQLESLASRPVFRKPGQRVGQLAEQLDELDERLKRAVKQRISLTRERVSAIAHSLNALSPLAVLARGYSMTFRATINEDQVVERKALVNSFSDVQVGDDVATYLHSGLLICRVEQVIEPPPKN